MQGWNGQEEGKGPGAYFHSADIIELTEILSSFSRISGRPTLFFRAFDLDILNSHYLTFSLPLAKLSVHCLWLIR